MSKFWFFSVLLVFAVLMTEAHHHPDHTDECAHSVLINSTDHCKEVGLYRTQDCRDYFQCDMVNGTLVGFKGFCDQGNIFNGSHCISEPTDEKTKEQVCAQFKCSPNSSQQGRDDTPEGLHEHPSTTNPTSTKTLEKSQVTPRASRTSGVTDVRPQMMTVFSIILPVLLRLF